ncbi:zf-TFIIB domain-containing protein [Ferrimonas balearica]|nr:zf-TFIIB domain-containing protein [Ferrimonas balearica]
MIRRHCEPTSAVEIDECPRCGGIWLDSGELEQIHRNRESKSPIAHSAAKPHAYRRFAEAKPEPSSAPVEVADEMIGSLFGWLRSL